MQAEPGTYALVLESQSWQQIQVGRWRALELRPGYYVYIGSAFGPGGLRARVARHFRQEKKLRWHIDYLRVHTTPLGVWLSNGPLRLEHIWATRLARSDGFTPLPGFGSSDCRCQSHLFQTERVERLAPLLDEVNEQTDWWPCPDF